MDWKVLVIDDDAGIRKVTALALEEAGYNVVTAPDGETGLKVCEETEPHIVITDIGMPGIDGLEVLRRIKEADPQKEVIVSTAFSDIALAIRALQLDASGFVTKPVGNDSLTSALERAKERYIRRKDILDYTELLEKRWLDTAEELAKTFYFQKMLIESSMDGIVGCDRRGKVIIFNRSVEELLGYSKTDVIGNRSFLDFLAPGEAARFQDGLYSEESGGENRLLSFETELISCDGGRVPVTLSAKVLFQEDEMIGMVTFIRKMDEPRG